MPIDCLVSHPPYLSLILKQWEGGAISDMFTHWWDLSITPPYLTFPHYEFSTKHGFFFFTSITVVRTLIKAILYWNWKRQVLCHMDYMRIQSFILAFAPIWHCWTFIPDSIWFYILFISLFIFQDPNSKHPPTCFKEYLHKIQLIKLWLSLW